MIVLTSEVCCFTPHSHTHLIRFMYPAVCLLLYSLTSEGHLLQGLKKCPCEPFLGRPFPPVSFSPPCRDQALLSQGITQRYSPAEFSLPTTHVSTNSYICPRTSGPLGSRWVAALANPSLTDLVTMRPGPCLWSIRLGAM